MTYKVKTRTQYNTNYDKFRTFSEYETLEEAMAVAKRLEDNTELEVVVDLPSGSTWCFDNTVLKLVES